MRTHRERALRIPRLDTPARRGRDRAGADLRSRCVASAIGRSKAVSGTLDVAPTNEHLADRLAQREMTRADRERVDAALLFDGSDGYGRLFRVAILTGLSAAIATFGVAADSTAVVIGAMLIAPLMTPILAAASATLQGWTGGALGRDRSDRIRRGRRPRMDAGRLPGRQCGRHQR